MSILLLILKIIGIVLLVLLALVILFIIGILFVPYAYRVKGSFHGKPDLTASIYGLGHLVGIGVILTESGAKMYLRICGIRKSLQSGNKDNKTGNTDQYEERVSENPKPDTHEKPAIQEVGEARETDNDDVSSADAAESLENETDVFPAADVQASGKFPKKIKSWIAKIKNFFYTLKQAFYHMKQTIRKMKQLLTDESHKRAFAKVKTSVWQLLKILMPRRLKLNLEYSTGSPDTTAQLLGILAMFPIGYQNRWKVHPDFTAENAYAEADFDVKGRVLGFSFLKLLLGLVLDKDCRKLYNDFMTMKA